MHVRQMALAVALTSLVLSNGCGGGGGSYNPPGGPTPPSGGGNTTVTVTIRAGGTVDPKEVRVDIGQTVRFVNEDSRAHQPQSNPHLQHTDCPSINSVGTLQPGESRTTGAFTTERACGYLDHMLPDTDALRGTIRVAGAEGPARNLHDLCTRDGRSGQRERSQLRDHPAPLSRRPTT